MDLTSLVHLRQLRGQAHLTLSELRSVLRGEAHLPPQLTGSLLSPPQQAALNLLAGHWRARDLTARAAQAAEHLRRDGRLPDPARPLPPGSWARAAQVLCALKGARQTVVGRAGLDEARLAQQALRAELEGGPQNSDDLADFLVSLIEAGESETDADHLINFMGIRADQTTLCADPNDSARAARWRQTTQALLPRPSLLDADHYLARLPTTQDEREQLRGLMRLGKPVPTPGPWTQVIWTAPHAPLPFVRDVLSRTLDAPDAPLEGHLRPHLSPRHATLMVCPGLPRLGGVAGAAHQVSTLALLLRLGEARRPLIREAQVIAQGETGEPLRCQERDLLLGLQNLCHALRHDPATPAGQQAGLEGLIDELRGP